MSSGEDQVWVTIEGERFLVRVEDLSSNPVVAYVDGSRFEVFLDRIQERVNVRSSQDQDQETESVLPADAACDITAPMPGDIVEIHVRVGQGVKTGDALCVLDAMKMKNVIHSPRDGRIAEICVQAGQSVEYGTPLFNLE